MARVHSYEWVQDALLDGHEDDGGQPLKAPAHYILQTASCFAADCSARPSLHLPRCHTLPRRFTYAHPGPPGMGSSVATHRTKLIEEVSSRTSVMAVILG